MRFFKRYGLEANLMSIDKPLSLEAEDFENAMQEQRNIADFCSVKDLMEIQQSAQKYARLRIVACTLVKEVMTQPAITIKADDTLAKAADILINHKISGLPIVDDENKLTGIITEADFLRVLGIPAHHSGHSLWQTLEDLFSNPIPVQEPEGVVKDLMVTSVFTVTPEESIQQAIAIMKENRIKRLVVTNDQQIVAGMLTRSNLLHLFLNHFKVSNKS
jgi:CBS domain-containing membrane protein